MVNSLYTEISGRQAHCTYNTHYCSTYIHVLLNVDRHAHKALVQASNYFNVTVVSAMSKYRKFSAVSICMA